MASVDETNQAAPEPTGEPETPKTEEPQGKPESEEIEHLRKENADLKRDYAALKTDYDKNARKSKSEKSEKAPSEEETLWLVENADSLKMCRAEYQAYRAKGYAKEDSLRLAKLDKGLVKSENPEASRQAETSSPVQGEHRASTKSEAIPEGVKKVAPNMTPEQYRAYKEEIEARKKALRM